MGGQFGKRFQGETGVKRRGRVDESKGAETMDVSTRNITTAFAAGEEEGWGG